MNKSKISTNMKKDFLKLMSAIDRHEKDNFDSDLENEESIHHLIQKRADTFDTYKYQWHEAKRKYLIVVLIFLKNYTQIPEYSVL